MKWKGFERQSFLVLRANQARARNYLGRYRAYFDMAIKGAAFLSLFILFFWTLWHIASLAVAVLASGFLLYRVFGIEIIPSWRA